MPGGLRGLGRFLNTADEAIPLRRRVPRDRAGRPLTRTEEGRRRRPQHYFETGRIQDAFENTHPWHEKLGRSLSTTTPDPAKPWRTPRGGLEAVSPDYTLNEDLAKAFADYSRRFLARVRPGELSSAQTHGFFQWLEKNGRKYGISPRHSRLAYAEMLGRNAKIPEWQRIADQVNPATVAAGSAGAGTATLGVLGLKKFFSDMGGDYDDTPTD